MLTILAAAMAASLAGCGGSDGNKADTSGSKDKEAAKGRLSLLSGTQP